MLPLAQRFLPGLPQSFDAAPRLLPRNLHQPADGLLNAIERWAGAFIGKVFRQNGRTKTFEPVNLFLDEKSS